MTIKISQKIIDYFANPTSLLVAVNKMSAYMNLSQLDGAVLSISNDKKNSIEIDESELYDAVLTDGNLFELIAFYAMAVGE